MNDREKINAALRMLKQLKRMVGFFMKKEISELIEQLERNDEIKSEPEKIKKSFHI